MQVDIYLSTLQCMDWMLTHRLVVPGTIVRYDDWPTLNATRGKARGSTFYGQKKAHFEVTKKHGVRWERVEGVGRFTTAFRMR